MLGESRRAEELTRRSKLACSAPVAQLDRAFASEAKGQKFESSRVHHAPAKPAATGSLFIASAYFRGEAHAKPSG